MSNVQSALQVLPRLLNGGRADVSFVSPLLSTTIAALCLNRSMGPLVRIEGAALSYARTVGLEEALSGHPPTKRPDATKSYSALARLDEHEQVERASAVINDFIYDQLASHHTLATHIGRVVGELHDNVASHAHAPGFSAAQNYGATLEVAIADAGRGMMANVRRKVSAITDDAAAIRWCLQRGNTTGAVDEMAQFLPSDAESNPYPDSVDTRSSANHHLGEGLWQLTELVKATKGSLFVWSGSGAVFVDETGEKIITVPRWKGVVIELSLPVSGVGPVDPDMPDSELNILAKRLGL